MVLFLIFFVDKKTLNFVQLKKSWKIVTRIKFVT